MYQFETLPRDGSTSENIKIKIFQLLHLLVSYDQVGDVVDGSEAEALRHTDLPVQFIYELMK